MYTLSGLIQFAAYMIAVIGTLSLLAALYLKDKK